MSKGLESLENLINKTGIINDTCGHLLTCFKCGKCKFEEPMETCEDYQLVRTIECELKALEIIKKKNVDVFFLRNSCDTVEEYNEEINNNTMYYCYDNCRELTQEEFELLK